MNLKNTETVSQRNLYETAQQTFVKLYSYIGLCIEAKTELGNSDTVLPGSYVPFKPRVPSDISQQNFMKLCIKKEITL